ncbi:MAG: bifunctional diaminohydroxyphosphoribosylaminopyrimidine deaminase/5-amino-6-(5-phosphoribosylamino)uracil reductase RibD [Armatimonadota bacterium]
MSLDLDRYWMRRAIALAKRAVGRTSPNPAVGAVIVRNNQMVGCGYTHPPGGPHAEIVALHQAGELARGAVLYVTLEPCSHFGRTPPCCQAIINSGISRVVCAMEDPFPLVNGKGVEQLKNHGIQVEIGLLREEALRVNEWYPKYVSTKIPFVTYKFAMSLDGKTATRTGDSKWISGEEARKYSHRLRRINDAVMCGIETALKDDPMLTPRPRGRTRRGYPLRIVVDSNARLPTSAALFKDVDISPVLVAVAETAPSERVKALRSAGAEVAVLPAKFGRVDPSALMQELGRREITSVLLEGGGTLAASLLEAGYIDKVIAFIAPIIVGGDTAPSPIGGSGADKLVDAVRIHNVTIRRMGSDVVVEGYLRTEVEQPCSQELSRRSGA